jgi:uncharacterized protein (TIGR03435 family)
MKRMLLLFLFATTELEFEVATIKPNTSQSGVNGGCNGTDSKPLQAAVPLGRCWITSARLSHLIAVAYGIQIQNIKGGPDWVWGAERFDIEAKAENPSTATEIQLLSMLQKLLADRFHLVLHKETKQVAGHALVPAKGGPKFKEAGGEGKSSLRISGAAIFKPDAIERRNIDLNTILAQKVSMSQLAAALTNLPDSTPTVDKTGLHGFYDFKLSWEPAESLSSVLQEQLGLKLEAQMVPVDVLIVDSAQKPAEN